jgi:hypothetical protein
VNIVEQTNALPQEHGNQRKHEFVDEPPVDELLRDILRLLLSIRLLVPLSPVLLEHPGNVVTREHHVRSRRLPGRNVLR